MNLGHLSPIGVGPALPPAPSAGQIYLNTTTGQTMLYTGVTWILFNPGPRIELNEYRYEDWDYVTAIRRRNRIFALVPIATIFMFIGATIMKTNLAIAFCLLASAGCFVAYALM